ncbi:hypothetical protein ACSBR1_008928 [Camellia fascicularis]
MMLEPAGLLQNSAVGSGGATVTTAVASAVNLENEEEGGGGGGGFGEEETTKVEDGDRSLTGNRWPREETLALLKIRSDMDLAFRDSTLKAPLWDQVSRKLAALGYHRNGKKCKEKFENIYKYHKRTKECRSSRQKSKSYRFFEQLELFASQSSLPSVIQPSVTETTMATTEMTMTDMEIKPSSVAQEQEQEQDHHQHQHVTISCSIPNHPTSSAAAELVVSTSTSTTSTSGKESEINGKKRKFVNYFERLMKEVLEKQEKLQEKFIDALEKCEKDRIAREEAWKMQELARIKREQEMIAEERAIAAAKDAALISFLQKISGQASPVQLPQNPTPTPIPVSIPIPPEKVNEKQGNDIITENSTQVVSSSRWPKAEVEALIRLRTNLDLEYQDNGPKGPLWEEVSLSMKKIGYNRNAKRCKEKWENINKYFKRVKDSNKKRPEDSKTCPYFEMLESIYERKSKKVDNSDNSGCYSKPEDILMLMMGQQQQQPPPQPQQQHQQQQRPESLTEDGESENTDQNQEDNGGDDDDDDDDNGDDYQIVANKPFSVTNIE